MRIADDFGLGRAHDRAILSLLEVGQLDGTSVMVNSAIAANDIERLRQLRMAGRQVGLHLNFTQALPGIGPICTLDELMRPIPNARTLDAITKSLIRQANTFSSLLGYPPDFYDGHQHCHCFPAVAPLMIRLPFAPRTWVRVPLPATWAGRWLNFRAGGVKVLAIMALAAKARIVFTRDGLITNKDFSGFLRLNDPASVRLWLPRLLSAANPNCLIMLHPGDSTDRVQCDGHTPESRAIEAQILLESSVR